VLTVYVFLQSWFVAHRQGDEGQATAEYALVLLGAAAVALLLVAWATHTNRIGKLLDSVVEKLLAEVK
jgi:hypothetical protein